MDCDLTELTIGCSGWSYPTWVGPFYPPGSHADQWLQLYSRVFPAVEIDSTFYRIPDTGTVKNWRESVSDGFRFYPKLPKQITHEYDFRNADSLIDSFIIALQSLGIKLGTVLIQFPPSLTYTKGREWISILLRNLPSGVRYAVEFRHNSWFHEFTYSMLRNHEITLTWSEIPYAEIPAVLTSDEIYLRLVGDRSIGDSEIGTVLKDRSAEIRKWISEIEKNKDLVERVAIFSNNHFQGFGPATVNLVRNALGLNSINWITAMQSISDGRQGTLF